MFSSRTRSFFEVEAEESTDEEYVCKGDEYDEDGEPLIENEFEGFIVDHVDDESGDECSSRSSKWDPDDDIDDDDIGVLEDAGFDVSQLPKRQGKDDPTDGEAAQAPQPETSEWIQELQYSGSYRAFEIAKRLYYDKGTPGLTQHDLKQKSEELFFGKSDSNLAALAQTTAKTDQGSLSHEVPRKKRRLRNVFKEEEHVENEVADLNSTLGRRRTDKSDSIAAVVSSSTGSARTDHAQQEPKKRKCLVATDKRKMQEEQAIEDELEELNGGSFSLSTNVRSIASQAALKIGVTLPHKSPDRRAKPSNQSKPLSPHCRSSSSESSSSSSSSSSTSSSESEVSQKLMTPVKSSQPPLHQRERVGGGVQHGPSFGGKIPSATITSASKTHRCADANAASARVQKRLAWAKGLEASGSARALELAQRLRSSIVRIQSAGLAHSRHKPQQCGGVSTKNGQQPRPQRSSVPSKLPVSQTPAGCTHPGSVHKSSLSGKTAIEAARSRQRGDILQRPTSHLLRSNPSAPASARISSVVLPAALSRTRADIRDRVPKGLLQGRSRN